jgi:hypothetical protein
MKSEAGDTKQQWVHGHAERSLQRWRRRQSPFRVAPEYIRQLERDLTRFYDQPLMRSFIENTA